MGQLKCLGSYDRCHDDGVSGNSDISDYEDFQSQTTNWMPTLMQQKRYTCLTFPDDEGAQHYDK